MKPLPLSQLNVLLRSASNMHNHKPIFHITGERGWINDPNGIVKFNGKYHVFYQHHPYSCEWGPMHWGHVVSDDLIHWEYLPYVLTPGDEFDKDGCFSGTSLVKDGILYVAYTGFINSEKPEDIRQIQCLASSKDGIHFIKHGAILTEKDLPKEYLPTDFRDPKLFFKDGFFHLMVAAKRRSGGGDILLYQSKDLKEWRFVNSVLTHPSEGGMIECTDYHEDLGLLLYSEQDYPKESDHCLNIHSCEYEIGQLNKEGKFIPSSKKTLIDYGFDFYAPQVMNDEHILIAWMNMWDRNNPTSKYGFAGMMTYPRKVVVKDNMMLQEPVPLTNKIEELEINSSYKGHLSVGMVKLEIEDLKDLSINLRIGEKEITKFYLKENEFYFDRSQSGETITGREEDEYSTHGIRKMPYIRKNTDEIYLILDKYSVEIFVNGVVMSNLIFPKENSDGLEISVQANHSKMSIFQ